MINVYFDLADAARRCAVPGLEKVRHEAKRVLVKLAAVTPGTLPASLAEEAAFTLQWVEGKLADQPTHCDDHGNRVESWGCECCGAPCGLVCDGTDGMCGFGTFRCSLCGDSSHDEDACRAGPPLPAMGTRCAVCGRTDTALTRAVGALYCGRCVANSQASGSVGGVP